MKFSHKYVKITKMVILVILLALFLFGIYLYFFKGGAEGFSDIYSYYGSTNKGDSQTANLIVPQQEQSCSQIKGFSGLFCNTPVASIDPFYGSESNMTCQGSGLTRSGGNVCLDKTQMHLLTTRGGNLTAPPSI